MHIKIIIQHFFLPFLMAHTIMVHFRLMEFKMRWNIACGLPFIFWLELSLREIYYFAQDHIASYMKWYVNQVTSWSNFKAFSFFTKKKWEINKYVLDTVDFSIEKTCRTCQHVCVSMIFYFYAKQVFFLNTHTTHIYTHIVLFCEYLYRYF